MNFIGITLEKHVPAKGGRCHKCFQISIQMHFFYSVNYTYNSLIQALISIKLVELYFLQAENNNETQVICVCIFK